EASTSLPETGELWHFEIYGSVAAGKKDAKPLEGEYVSVPASFLRRKGVTNPQVVRVYKVNGDCMVSDEVRRMERNIAPGDYVFVDTSRRPRPGDVVVAWWPAGEKMVLKRYRVEGQNIVLYPASPAHPVVVLPSEEDVNIVGVVVARFG
ncbi:MAG: S24 family peptidase, partial [Thermus sp.]|uniref:LexA family protein n=1 Tax=Thermus sp. TaxID=275 RepID=UPI0025CFF7C3